MRGSMSGEQVSRTTAESATTAESTAGAAATALVGAADGLAPPL